MCLPLQGCYPAWLHIETHSVALIHNNVSASLFADEKILQQDHSTLLSPIFSHIPFHFVIGIDGVSLFFVILTCFLIPVCLLVGWNSVQSYVKEYCIAFLLMETLMIAVFSVLDLLLFYIFL